MYVSWTFFYLEWSVEFLLSFELWWNIFAHVSNCVLEKLYGFYQQLKRKSETADYEADSSDRTTVPGFTEVINSSLQTPVSVKGGKANKTSRLTKCNKSGPQTPVTNVGEY